MQYLRHVNEAKLGAAAPTERYSEWLLDHTSGATADGLSASINWIKTPPGSGSPAGLHTHAVDQIFYIVSGLMNIEIQGQQFEAGPGSLVIFPRGVPHRNWNAGAEPTVHLAFNTPLADPSVPFQIPYKEPAKA